jgi:hypothetical protein
MVQSITVHRDWGVPCVRFGPGGWPISLGTGTTATADGGTTEQLSGVHLFSGTPYALVDTGGTPTRYWVRALDHEVVEMMVDPLADPLHYPEIADQVENITYTLQGVPGMSDYMLPNGHDHLGRV